MASGGEPGHTGPAALSDLFGAAPRKLPGADGPTSSDGMLFSGNRHESVPRALFLDRRLTPLERNAWQIFRMQLQADGLTAFPTYDQLAPFLASMPCAAQASHETVARALMLLRLTRWLSLVRRRRDARTGRLQGNVYVLHDEPLTPFEAMQLDAGYLGLVSQALTHASKAVRTVGLYILGEMDEDPLLRGRALPTRLQLLMQRMRSGGVVTESYPQEGATHESEEGQGDRLRNRAGPTSDSEPGRKTAPDGPLRNPKQDSTVRTERSHEVRTVPRASGSGDKAGGQGSHGPEDGQPLQLHECFLLLKTEQRHGALLALQQVDAAQRQAVLDEWAARCQGSKVRNPAGYLFGIIQKAIRGEFKVWAGGRDLGEGMEPPGKRASAATPPPARAGSTSDTGRRAADPEIVRTELARMRALLQGR